MDAGARTCPLPGVADTPCGGGLAAGTHRPSSPTCFDESDAAREGQAQLTGAVRWRAPDLMLDRLDLTHSGPATSTVMVDEFARITNNGTGQIDIGGTADCDIRSTGSARIICGNGENFRQR